MFTESNNLMPDPNNNSVNSQAHDFLKIRDFAAPGIDKRLAIHQEEGYLKAKFNFVDLDQSSIRATQHILQTDGQNQSNVTA